MPSEGDVIGPYRLLRPLGAGAFGEVWLVQHLHLEVERAMKVPTDPDYVRQLQQEGRIQFVLQHPNIVPTIELDLTHEPPYFVMEYVQGQNLRTLLAARGKLPPAEAVAILSQVLEGLAFAHGQGVIHRDLKPENVLLTADGTAKIADFGIGRVQAEVTQTLLKHSMFTSQGKSLSGTYVYMSPEQQDGQPPDPGDDLYAVGILGCELLAGRRPAAGRVARLLEKEGVDERLGAALQKALDEAEFRYPSATAMKAALAGAAPHAAPAQDAPEPPAAEAPKDTWRQVTAPRPGARSAEARPPAAGGVDIVLLATRGKAEEIAGELTKLSGLPRDEARRLVASPPSVLFRNADRQMAGKIQDHFKGRAHIELGHAERILAQPRRTLSRNDILRLTLAVREAKEAKPALKASVLWTAAVICFAGVVIGGCLGKEPHKYDDVSTFGGIMIGLAVAVAVSVGLLFFFICEAELKNAFSDLTAFRRYHRRKLRDLVASFRVTYMDILNALEGNVELGSSDLEKEIRRTLRDACRC